MKRLHDARHTAATVLALPEVAPRTTMDIMRWSDPAMLLRYGHVTDTMRREIAGRQDAFYFGGTTEGNAGPVNGD
jgi:integrase